MSRNFDPHTYKLDDNPKFCVRKNSNVTSDKRTFQNATGPPFKVHFSRSILCSNNSPSTLWYYQSFLCIFPLFFPHRNGMNMEISSARATYLNTPLLFRVCMSYSMTKCCHVNLPSIHKWQQKIILEALCHISIMARYGATLQSYSCSRDCAKKADCWFVLIDQGLLDFVSGQSLRGPRP